jgi:peptide/nickel transport system ATP-binding protein
MSTPILEVRDLSVEFTTEAGLVKAVQNLAFTLKPGETLGIVGESGSGKSTTSLTAMGLLPKSARVTGEILFKSPKSTNGKPINLLTLNRSAMQKYRGAEISMVFQEPLTSLNPVYTCGSQVIEAIRLHEPVSHKEAYRRTLSLFDEVKLPNPKQIINRYPHELSGGQMQRVMIAMAICCNPAILLADEPTTALDVTIQATIIDIMQELQDQRGMAIIFVTHDLGVIANIADSVIVMYQGKSVEYGAIQQIFTNPQHPYTKGLLACRPALNRRVNYLPTVSDFMEVVTTPDGEEVLREKQKLTTRERTVTNEELTQRLARLQQQSPLLCVQNLQVFFPLRGLFGRTTNYVKAVNDVSFEVYPGETLGLVGESGCGKTTLGQSLIRLIEPTGGKVFFEERDISKLPEKQMRLLRRDMQMIFQDPYGALDSRMTIAEAVMEPMRVHDIAPSAKQRRHRTADLLERVGLSSNFMGRYPHELSGGQRQRVCIARALALNPKLIICDESVSALDVSVQAQVLNLLKELQSEFNLTYIFISHDLSVVKFISDRIMVMNQGKIEEIGAAESVFNAPKREYTHQLIQAIRGAKSEE